MYGENWQTLRSLDSAEDVGFPLLGLARDQCRGSEVGFVMLLIALCCRFDRE